MITTLETVRAMWTSGKTQIDAERTANGFGTPEYFAKLEALVESIKEHLKKHELLKVQEHIVKHGESTIGVLVDFPSMAVIRDPQDPERPFFHIPAIPKEV